MIVTGHKGQAGIFAAMERGEAQAGETFLSLGSLVSGNRPRLF